MNKFELMEASKRQHEYDMMDRRMGEQRIIDRLENHVENEIRPIEKRVTRLEHWRTFLTGAMAGVTSWLGFRGH